MWSEIAPDRCHNIAVEGYNVVAYQFGDGDETILCLNGGPGLPCDYLREAHACLKQHGYRVIAFDQLGTGKSDRYRMTPACGRWRAMCVKWRPSAGLWALVRCICLVTRGADGWRLKWHCTILAQFAR
ncbi:hypothetical protein QYS46_23075 [Klebsiella michiganensis]|nr:hypothetical protein [Klebsiella michiganensis]